MHALRRVDPATGAESLNMAAYPALLQAIAARDALPGSDVIEPWRVRRAQAQADSVRPLPALVSDEVQ